MGPPILVISNKVSHHCLDICSNRIMITYLREQLHHLIMIRIKY